MAARLPIGSNVAPGTESEETIHFEPLGHSRLQAERFGRQIRGSAASRWPLDTGLADMQVLDAIRRSGTSGRWEPASDAAPSAVAVPTVR